MVKANPVKKIFSVLLAVCLLLTAVPMAAAKTVKGNPGSMILATASDIHYYPESLAKYKSDAFYTYLQGSNITYEDMNSILDSTFAALKKDHDTKGLKYLVLSGDLTVNGEYEGHVALAERLRKFEAESGVKVFVTNGNHDINNSNASAFVTEDGAKTPARKTTPQEFYEIYREFGFNQAYSRFKEFDCGEDGALSYAVKLDGGYRLIVADGGKYTHFNTASGEDEHETGGSFSPALVEWIIARAKEATDSNETPILVTHWNVSGMNYLHEYLLQGFVIDDCYKLQEVLADNGINYAFSGHQHVSDIDITYSDSGEPMYSVITPTLSEFPFSFRETLFDRDENGTVRATFEQYHCDEVQPVVNGDTGAPYTRFYRETTGFNKQMGNGSGAEYLLRMVKSMLSDYIVGIQNEGSVVAFVEKKFNINIEQMLNDLVENAGSMIKTENETVNKILEFMQPFFRLLIKFIRDEIRQSTDFDIIKNVMNFIGDLDAQIMNNYIYKTDELYAAMKNALENLMQVKVSDVPCTKFINTYGFGDATKPGTVEDMFFSVLIYMYVGNEQDNIKDDLFMQDVLKRCGETEFVDLVFDNVIKYVVEDLAVDNILGTLKINLGALASDNEEAVYIFGFVQLFFFLAVSAYDAWTETGIDLKNLSFNSIFEFGQFIKIFNDKIHNDSEVSFKNIIELVLETGKIDFGTSINGVIYHFLNSYIGETQKKAIAQQLKILLETMLYDEDRDWDVTYIYSGPAAVTPTVEDRQLPSGVTVSQGRTDDSYSITWLTKYSVTGTDIELIEENGKFTGVPTVAENIKTSSKTERYGGYGFDFGTFGIFPWTREGVRHTVEITGLEANTVYKFRIGDAAKGFWSDTGSFTTGGSDGFTFLFMTDIAATDEKGYGVWHRTLASARKTVPEAEMMLLGGDSVYVGGNDDQWSWALDKSNSVFLNLPVMSAAGDKEPCDVGALRYFSLPKTADGLDTRYGSYYSFDRENVHFIVLNTNDRTEGGNLSAAQSKWLKKDLADNAGAQWKIVLMHEPAYNAEGTMNALRTQLLEYKDIDLILEGNDRIYARSYVLSDDIPRPYQDKILKKIGSDTYEAYIDVNGLISVLGGTAGSTSGKATGEKSALYDTVYDERPVFTAIRVEGDSLAFDAYAVNDDGSTLLIDSFGITTNTLRALRGDLNSDGEITVADARLALRAAVGLDSPRALAKLCADVDNSRSVTVSDARTILRVAVGLESFAEKFVEYTKSQLLNMAF